MDDKVTTGVIIALISSVVGFGSSSVLFGLQLYWRRMYERRIIRRFIYDSLGKILLNVYEQKDDIKQYADRPKTQLTFMYSDGTALSRQYEAYQKAYLSSSMEIKEAVTFGKFIDNVCGFGPNGFDGTEKMMLDIQAMIDRFKQIETVISFEVLLGNYDRKEVQKGYDRAKTYEKKRRFRCKHAIGDEFEFDKSKSFREITP